MKPPIPLEEAQARLLAMAPALPVEHVDVEGALGRYLAEPLLAGRTHPAADCSAMDGYAVAAHDLAGPWSIIGESAAGHPFDGELVPGQAVRISTGALIPAGAGAVIVQEDVTRDDGVVQLSGDGPSPPARHIRRSGMDFVAGEQVLPAGTRIGPAQAALALAAGHRHLPVRRRVRVAVLDSGDELARDPEACPSHLVPASNGAMLAAMVAALPCDTRRLGPIRDSARELAAAFDEAADADVLVTSGGASVGDHDLIRPALEAWGARLDFWRVAIKPGKPLLVATRHLAGRPQISVGLPGNPVSSHVTAFLFLLPLLRAMCGAGQPLPRPVSTTLGAATSATGSRREFVRATWDGTTATPRNVQDSGALGALAASNFLIDREAHSPAVEAGSTVRGYLIDNGWIW